MANQCGFKMTTDFSSIMEGTDFCEHCTAEDLSKAVGFFYEKDSFGYVFTEIACKECEDKGKEEEDNKMVCCDDCKGTFLRKETTEWRWYDFYAAQGDEPCIICDECWNKPAHQSRMARDKADYDAEFGYGDFDEDDGYDDY